MLADAMVSVMLDAITRGRMVELEIDSSDLIEISEIEHVGQGLVRFRYPGLPNDHYVSETRIKSLRVRHPESEW